MSRSNSVDLFELRYTKAELMAAPEAERMFCLLATGLTNDIQVLVRHGREGCLKKSASEGYRMLLNRGWSELTFETVAFRHPQRFQSGTLAAAKARLQGSGVSV